MATTLTMLDIAKRNGSDPEIGLIEDVVTFAPELGVFAVRPIHGTSFRSTLRTAYPTAQFRQTGAGVQASKSGYEQKLTECFFLDCQLQVPEEIPDAEDRTVGDVMAQEAVGAMRGVGITAAKQIYYGTSAAGDTNGFQGLITTVGSAAGLTVSAGSTGTNTCTSAWLTYLDIDGLHLVAGRTAAARSAGNVGEPSGEPVVIAPPFRMPEWTRQQVALGTSGSVAFAFVTNMSGWLGLAYGSRYSAFRIRNIAGSGTTNPMTDVLAAQLLALVPLHIRNSGRLRWFINRQAAYGLQQSRTVTAPTNQSGGAGGAWIAAPFPTECQGIPIIPTDSLINTEASV